MELEDASKLFGKYNAETKSSDFTINGQDYKVTINNGKYVITYTDANSE